MIEVGDRVFYLEMNRIITNKGFGLVVDMVVEKSEKFKAIHEKIIGTRVFVILKDNGELEEFLEVDLKKVVDI